MCNEDFDLLYVMHYDEEYQMYMGLAMSKVKKVYEKFYVSQLENRIEIDL